MCHSNIHFNPEQLQVIKNSLNQMSIIENIFFTFARKTGNSCFFFGCKTGSFRLLYSIFALN